jgi:hypothetical protein
VKSRRFGGRNVLDPALEPPGHYVGLGAKLNDESRVVLPSFHEWTIIERALTVIILP